MELARGAVTVALAIGLLACGDDGPPRADPPATTGPVATDLAPSQVTASTVAPPAAPPPCDVDVLELTPASEGIVAIRNTGPIECEVDVSESPNRDPLMEPGVWLHSGGEGELAVEPTDEGCGQPAVVTSIDLVVNGEPVTAPIELPATCGAILIAIYTAD